MHPPFEPTVVEGPDGPELHARGAIDDKGNVAFHLLGMRAHLAATGRDTPAVTVKLLIEGEEESGSPNFAALLRERADRLACDVVVVSDTGMAAPDVPSAVVAMRGLADAEITLRGPGVDLHSGSFGGGVPNPLHAMAELLAPLHDEHGRVTLPGFYDRVRPLADRERELMAPGALRRAGVAGRARPPPGCHRRGGLQHARADRRPARPPRSTACGAATPAPATRRSSRPRRTRRCPSGWSPTSAPRTSARRCAPGSRRTSPRASRPRCTPRPAASPLLE